MVGIEEEIAGLAPGSHACLVHTEAQDRTRAVAAFFRQGLQASERCLYSAPAPAHEALCLELRRQGIAVTERQQQGALVLLDPTSVYEDKTTFEPKRQTAILGSLVDAARKDGFRSLRAVGEAIYPIEDRVDPKVLVEYEALASGVLRDKGASAICIYDRHRTAEGLLLDLIECHPLAMVGGRLCATPDAFVSQLAAGSWRAPTAVARDASLIAVARSLRRRDALIALIARQLGAPLPHLRAKLEAVGGEDRGEIMREIEGCREHLLRLTNLAEGLAAIVGFAAADRSLRPTSFDLAALVRETIEHLKSEGRSPPPDISLRMPETLAGCWDRERVLRVLQTVLNAATERSWGTPVQVDMERLRPFVRLTVSYRDPSADPVMDAPGRIPQSSLSWARGDDLEIALWLPRELLQLMGGGLGVSLWADARVVVTVDLPQLPAVPDLVS